MTRRSQREIERAIDRLDDEAADDGTTHVPSQFVHFDGSVEVLEEGPDDEPTTFDVVLTDDAGEVVEPDADDDADPDEAGDAGGDDEPADEREASDVVDHEPADDEATSEGDEGDDEAEPIEVTRMTRLRRRRLAESGGRRGGARYGPGRWRP